MREVKNIVLESDVLIYAIGVFGGGTTAEEAGGPGLLSTSPNRPAAGCLANPVELPNMAQKIGIELRNRYVLGYSPKNQERDGKYHHIEVKVVAAARSAQAESPLAAGI